MNPVSMPRIAVRLGSVACLLVAALQAQSTTAGITGTITDATGASVPGASITVSADAIGVTRQTRSSDLGNYTVSLLRPGVYQVTVSHDGFRPIARSGVELVSIRWRGWISRWRSAG